jgi:hypothetical protein
MDGGYAVKDLLHILLDIYEDKSSEMRLTRENIKAFILVNQSFRVLTQHSLFHDQIFLAHLLTLLRSLWMNIASILMGSIWIFDDKINQIIIIR